MDAGNVNLLKFLEDARQFIIPIYQRKYSWTSTQCEQLWHDILRAGKAKDNAGHFLGTVVYIANNDAHNAPLLIIDGQQRITTLTLLLLALAKTVGTKEPYDGFSARKIFNYYLVNEYEDGDRHNRLLLTETDRDTLLALVNGTPLPVAGSERILENYHYFQTQLARLDEQELKLLCRGIAKLLIVYVALARGQDNPQLIFESMNSTGLQLTQADLIRNFFLMGLEPDQQTRLYRAYWQPMEKLFGQEAYDTEFNSFMRHYLTVKTGSIPRLDEVYAGFKQFARTDDIKTIENIVDDMLRFACYYCAMALEGENDKELAQAFFDLNELKVDVAYPFLLPVYNDYANGTLEKSDFLEIVRLVEAYVFRRAICSIPTNSLNKTFATLYRDIDKSDYLESVKAAFSLMTSYRRFPTNEEFKENFQHRDLYHFRSRSYWLRRFENFGRKERVAVNDYTIEHIMPQSTPLPKDWQKMLGEDWRRIQETWLHTAGNLTLTGYNSEYGNRSFEDKRTMRGGFAESPLHLNKGLGELPEWTEKTIIARAKNLADQAVNIWCAPDISEESLERFKPEKPVLKSYTIADHPLLQNGITRELFEAFRKEILNLDDNVREEFLKLYIAYKAETNFVDVVPQSKQLTLNLNIAINELDDPRGLCRDISHLHRWGTGFVEAKFRSLDQLPYMVGLARQALEKQLGDDG